MIQQIILQISFYKRTNVNIIVFRITFNTIVWTAPHTPATKDIPCNHYSRMQTFMKAALTISRKRCLVLLQEYLRIAAKVDKKCVIAKRFS